MSHMWESIDFQKLNFSKYRLSSKFKLEEIKKIESLRMRKKWIKMV